MHTELLRLSFSLTNITSLRPDDEELIDYWFTLRCERCGLETEAVRACVAVVHQAERKRVANATAKCANCARTGIVSLLSVERDPITPGNCQNVGVMLFRYDGLVPHKYISNGGSVATTSNGEDIEVYLSKDDGFFHSTVDGLEVSIKLTDSQFETQR